METAVAAILPGRYSDIVSAMFAMGVNKLVEANRPVYRFLQVQRLYVRISRTLLNRIEMNATKIYECATLEYQGMTSISTVSG